MQRNDKVRTAQMYQREHIIQIAESPGCGNQCLDRAVGSLASGTVHVILNGVQDVAAMPLDLLGQLHKWLHITGSRICDPPHARL